MYSLKDEERLERFWIRGEIRPHFDDAETFKVRDELGFVKPKTYKKAREDLTKFIHKAGKKSAEGKVLLEESVRRLWAGTFISNTPEESAECLRILREQVDKGLESGAKKYLEITDSSNWRFMGPRSKMTVDELESKADSPLLTMAKEPVIVISNMAGSMPTTPLVIQALKNLGAKEVPYVLAGVSKNGETRFEDGKSMREEFFAPPSELKTLFENKGRVALVVDDSEITGVTYETMRKSLEKIGYKKIFKIATHDGNLLDGKGESVNHRGVGFTRWTDWKDDVFEDAQERTVPIRTITRGPGPRGIAVITSKMCELYDEESGSGSGIKEKMKELGKVLGKGGYDVVIDGDGRGVSEKIAKVAEERGSFVLTMNKDVPNLKMPQIPMVLLEQFKRGDKLFRPGDERWVFDRSNSVTQASDALVVVGWNALDVMPAFVMALTKSMPIGVWEFDGKPNSMARSFAKLAKESKSKIFYSDDPRVLVKKLSGEIAKREEAKEESEETKDQGLRFKKALTGLLEGEKAFDEFKDLPELAIAAKVASARLGGVADEEATEWAARLYGHGIDLKTYTDIQTMKPDLLANKYEITPMMRDTFILDLEEALERSEHKKREKKIGTAAMLKETLNELRQSENIPADPQEIARFMVAAKILSGLKLVGTLDDKIDAVATDLSEKGQIGLQTCVDVLNLGTMELTKRYDMTPREAEDIASVFGMTLRLKKAVRSVDELDEERQPTLEEFDGSEEEISITKSGQE